MDAALADFKACDLVHGVGPVTINNLVFITSRSSTGFVEEIAFPGDRGTIHGKVTRTSLTNVNSNNYSVNRHFCWGGFVIPLAAESKVTGTHSDGVIWPSVRAGRL